MNKFIAIAVFTGMLNIVFPYPLYLNAETENVAKAISNAASEDNIATIQGNSLLAYSGPDFKPRISIQKVLPQVIITAYSSTPDQTDDSPFITAMGTNVRDGIVATNFLPFNSQVRFPDLYGDKIFVVEDRMAKKNSHKIDIWFSTREDAKQFGVKRTKVEVLSI